MLPVLVLCLQIFGGSDFKTLQGGQHFSKAESKKVGKVEMAKCKTSVLILSMSLQLIETKSVGSLQQGAQTPIVQLRLAAHSPASVFKFGFFGCWIRECLVGV